MIAAARDRERRPATSPAPTSSSCSCSSIYVAIMAAKLQRIERELGALAELAERLPAAPGGARRRADPRARARDRGRPPGGAMSDLLALGVSHKTAPLELRERLALTEGRAVGVLRELVSEEPISEAAALSTCNRTELYLVVADPVEAETAALGVLAREAEIRPTELLGHLYSLRGTEAARHLFRVTAGLDSMIVGEAEIQGQVKRAYELALVEGATGPILNRLFRGALAAGKRARTETADRREGRLDPLGRGRARAAHPRRPLGPPRAADRRRRDRRADRPGAGRARRRTPSSSPTATTTARSALAAALRRQRGPLRRAARAARQRRHRRLRDQLAPPPHRARASSR